MKFLTIIAGSLLLGLPVLAKDEEPSLEMLLFLAEFTDEQGTWDGPSMEDALQEKENNEGEQYD